VAISTYNLRNIIYFVYTSHIYNKIIWQNNDYSNGHNSKFSLNDANFSITIIIKGIMDINHKFKMKYNLILGKSFSREGTSLRLNFIN
jgi:hypothetical protein